MLWGPAPSSPASSGPARSPPPCQPQKSHGGVHSNTQSRRREFWSVSLCQREQACSLGDTTAKEGGHRRGAGAGKQLGASSLPGAQAAVGRITRFEARVASVQCY